MRSHPPRALLTGAVLLLISAACGYAAGAVRHAPAEATRTVLAQKVGPGEPPGGRSRCPASRSRPTHDWGCTAIPGLRSPTSRKAR